MTLPQSKKTRSTVHCVVLHVLFTSSFVHCVELHLVMHVLVVGFSALCSTVYSLACCGLFSVLC